MKEPVKLPFSHPVVRRMVQAAYPGAKSRRPVRIECKTNYRVMDFWDGGSRDYAAFLQLSSMTSISSESIPKAARQVQSNPFNLPIAEVSIQPGYAVIEHTIFQGKDMGYTIILNAEDIPGQLPEAMSLVPLPPKEEFAELIEASEYPQELPEKF